MSYVRRHILCTLKKTDRKQDMPVLSVLVFLGLFVLFCPLNNTKGFFFILNFKVSGLSCLQVINIKEGQTLTGNQERTIENNIYNEAVVVILQNTLTTLVRFSL